jgi:hypothetical protein
MKRNKITSHCVSIAINSAQRNEENYLSLSKFDVLFWEGGIFMCTTLRYQNETHMTGVPKPHVSS